MEIGQDYNPRGIFKGIFIPNVIMECDKLTPIDKLLWGMLNKHAGDDRKCYPSQDLLAKEINCTTRSIIKSLQNLEDLKFVRIEKVSGKDKLDHLHNCYYFIWNEITENSCTPGSETRSLGGVNDIHPKEYIKAKEEIKPLKPNPLTPFSNSSINRRKRTTNIPTKQVQPVIRPTRPTIPFIKLFPANYQANKDFQSIWENYVGHREENRKLLKSTLTLRAVNLMIGEIIKNFPTDITQVIERFEWCIKNGRTAPNLKPWTKYNKKRGFNDELDPTRYDHLIEER